MGVYIIISFYGKWNLNLIGYNIDYYNFYDNDMGFSRIIKTVSVSKESLSVLLVNRAVTCVLTIGSLMYIHV